MGAVRFHGGLLTASWLAHSNPMAFPWRRHGSSYAHRSAMDVNDRL